MRAAMIVVCGVVLAAGGCAQTGGFGGGDSRTWQIVAKRFRGQGHYAKAKWVCESLKLSRGIDPNRVTLVHERDGTVVAYGRYRGIKDSQAKKDLTFFKSLGMPDQGYMFLDAHLEPVAEPDPPVPAGWMLTNSKGYWTLEIARFDQEGRKKDAVSLVRQLRSEHVPAYVRHGPIKSVVTVGAFPPNAVANAAVGRDKRRVIMMRPIPVDAGLKKWKKRFPYLIVNAAYINLKAKQGGKKAKSRLESKIMRVPK